MNSNLSKYIKKQSNKNKGKDLKFDIGYPINFKGHKVHGYAKSKLTKSMPFLLHFGNPLLIKPFWAAQHVDEEKSLIEELVAPWGGTAEISWGYISSGGSESNLTAIKFALKQFKPQKPILLFSSETHHSIIKFLDLCEHSFAACVKMPTNTNGEMAHTQIRNALEHCYVPGTPVVVIATLGTTMKGASDDILRIREALLDLGVEREKLFVHADAALSGGFWHLDQGHYPYQLGKEISSLSISGHKWYGCDVCSLFACARRDQGTQTGDYFEVIKTADLAISLSRNGFLAISWRIRLLQYDWQAEYDACQEMVRVSVRRFEELGVETLVNPVSITVCFPVPTQEIISKYVLATGCDAHLGNIAHIILLPHVSRDVIDSFFADLSLQLNRMSLKFTRNS